MKTVDDKPHQAQGPDVDPGPRRNEVTPERAEVLSNVAQKIIESMNAERLSSNEALIVLARIMGQCEAHGLLHGEMLGNPDVVHAEITKRIAEERDEYIEYARKAEQAKKEA